MDEDLFAALVERVAELEDAQTAYTVIVGDLIAHSLQSAEAITAMRERACTAIEHSLFDVKGEIMHRRANRALAEAESLFCILLSSAQRPPRQTR